MAAADQDDEFLDDDFDIGGDEFLELQRDALKATQRPKTPATVSPSKRPAGALKQLTAPKCQLPTRRSLDSEHTLNQSSDYGELDEEVLDGGVLNVPAVAAVEAEQVGKASYIPSESSQREQWRQHRYAAPSKGLQAPQANAGAGLPHRGASQVLSVSNRERRAGNPRTSVQDIPEDFKSDSNGASLDSRLQQLLNEKRLWEEERTKLLEDMKLAQDELLGKNGEISILRSNHTRRDKEQEKIISDLKRQQADREENHKRELELAQKEKESLATHNKFLDHEMNDTSWPAKKSKTKGTNGLATTPKKPRKTNLGDGFNDDELIVSPSKSAGKTKASTPKHGAKRKRDLSNDSPGPPLQVSPDAGTVLHNASTILQAPYPANHSTSDEDPRFEFLQLLLGHRIQPGIKRTFEVFTAFSFPSNQETTIASIFMDQMTQNSAKRDIVDYPASVGSIVLSIWSDCLDEQYYPPIRYLIDLMIFILLNGSIATVNQLVNDITRITQLTADVNVIPRFKSLTKSNRANAQKDIPMIEPSEDIDVYECLQLLLLTATICAADSNLVKHFWRSMRFDFISMLLRASQHVDDIIMTVKLLDPCVQDDQLGAIRPPDPSANLTSEQHIIDRLTSMLIEPLRPLAGAQPYDQVDIVEMRLEILLLLAQVCDNKLSGRAFALHPQALGRVVRAMSDELTSLYISLSGEEQRSEVVNHACRIVFYVTSKYESDIDLQEKLRSQPGGVNKYLIALSRLAFSDAIFFERGIEEDVFDYAHQMLEDFVTPEEGESLRKAFVRDDR